MMPKARQPATLRLSMEQSWVKSEGYAMIQEMLVSHRTRCSSPLHALPRRPRKRTSNQFSFILNPSTAMEILRKSYLMGFHFDCLRSSLFEFIHSYIHTFAHKLGTVEHQYKNSLWALRVAPGMVWDKWRRKGELA